MGISLNEYMTRRQREAGVKRTPVSSAAQEPVKAAWETGGSSLDRPMSAPKGGAWDIRRDRRGQRSATVSGGAPTSNAPAGSAAASYQRQTVPEDLRARLERTPDRQTVPEDLRARLEQTPNRQTVPEDLRARLEVPERAPAKHLGPVKDGTTAKTPSVRWKTPGETGERDWKRTARETFSAAGMMRFGAKADLDTKVKIAESKLPGLKEAEKEALARKNAAEIMYTQSNPLAEALASLVTGESGSAMSEYSQAAKNYDAARSKREETERAAAEAAWLRKYLDYEDLRRKPDFEENSVYIDTYDPENVVFNNWIGKYTSTGFDDLTYAYVNGDERAQSRQGLMDLNAGGPGSLYTETHSGWSGLPEDTVKLFNYIYKTQGPDQAYEYLTFMKDRGITGINSLALHFANTTGAFSGSAVLEKGLNAISGDADAPSAFYEDIQTDLARAREQHPAASTVGSAGGTLLLMSSIAAAVGTIPGFDSMPAIAQSVISGAASMGGTTAIQNAGYAVNGMESWSDYGLDVLTSSAAGGTSGLAAGGIGAVGKAVLQKLGLTDNMLAWTVAAGFAGASGAAARSGVQQGVDALRGKDEFDSGQLLEEALVGFAFASIGFLTRNFTASPRSAAAQDEGEALANKYFKGMTQEEAKAEYRRLSRVYHPDLHMNDTAEAKAAAEAVMKELNLAWSWINKTSGAQFYQDMQAARRSGDTAGYQSAKSGFDGSVTAIAELAAGGTLYGQEVREALAILEAVSKGGDIAENAASMPMAPTGTALKLDPDTQAVLRRTAEEMQARDAGEADMGTSRDPLAQAMFGQKVGGNTNLSADGASDGRRSLVQVMKEAQAQGKIMGPVAEIVGNELPQGKSIIDRLVNFASRIGNKVHRANFGDVLFSRSRIKNSTLGHGMGLAKIETFAAVPAVIQYGQQIDYQENWEGRGYDTYTFAAPVIYKGQNTYLGVIVTKDAQDGRYYVHEVIDENGNLIFGQKDGPADTSDGRASLSGAVDTVVSAEPSNTIIPQRESGVKPQFTQEGDALIQAMLGQGEITQDGQKTGGPEQDQSAALAYDIQRMRQIGATLGENGARALAAVYDETLAAQYAPEQVAESFIQIYNATLNGRRLSEAAARKAAKLPDYIRLAAEDSAQRDMARAGQTAERFSLKERTAQREITERYQKAVDSVMSGTYGKSQAILMGYTPKIYQELGMPSLPFVIGPGHVYSIAKTEEEARAEGRYNENTNYHGMGEEAVKELYSKTHDPVMVIASKDEAGNKRRSRSKHSVVAIVDVGTAEKSLLLPVEITAERTVNGQQMDVNVLSSAYEKDVSELVREAIAQENIGQTGVYYMTKKAEALIVDGVQFPKRLSEASASTGIVHRFQENVNMKIMDQTQSLQFKRWFGDWQNDPKHASKVVDAEGKPLVMYHGTPAKGITAFNKDFIGSRYGSDEVGFFFVDRKSIAEDYARSEFNSDRYGEVIPAYLSIKNPLVVDAKYVRENGYGDIFKSNDAIDAWDTYQGAFLEAAQKLGADGILVKDGTSTMAVAFRPTQIKSATENVGTFDRRDPDIRFSQELESIEELRRENERLKERVEYDPAVADVTGLNGLAAVESFAAGLPPALATTVREMYNEEQEPAAYLEDMMRAHKAGGEGITDPEPVFGPGMENAHITYFQAKAAMLAGQADAENGTAVGAGATDGYNNKYTAMEEAKSDEQAAGEVYLRDGGQRADGAYPGGAVRELEGGAGQDQGRDLKSRPADGGAASLIYGEKVTTASLGIGGGSGSDGIRLVRGGDTAATAGARKIARERGLRVVLFAGGDLTIRRGGVTIRARGYVSGDRVFIRVDHPEYTAEQIMRHEAGHDMIAKGELDPEAVRERIIRELGEGKTEQLTGMYEAAYRGTSLTAEEVWEEVVCDSLGDMNIFSGTIHEEAARELLKPTKEAAGAERETAKTRGPPAEAAENKARYSINKSFRQDVALWDEAGRPDGEMFILGSTGPGLQGLGAIESDIYMEGDKVKKILQDHPEMTLNEIKRIPEILEDPVLILKSKGKDSRMVLFGTLKARDGRPVMCVLDLRPIENGFLLNDMQKVNSAYTKDTEPVKFVTSSNILHADKKRTIPLLRTIGMPDPIALQRSGSIGSITYKGSKVNLSGVPFSEVVSTDKSKYSQDVAAASANVARGQESAAGQTAERFSLKERTAQREITERYQKAVDSVMSGTYGKSQAILMGYTPKIYQELGMPSLPFVIGPGHVYSIAKTEEEARAEGRYNENTNYHGMGEEAVKELYRKTHDPVMVIASKDEAGNKRRSRSKHSVVAIVDVGTAEKSLLLPVEITAERNVNGGRMDVNVLSSAYEKDVSELVREAIAQENIGQTGVYYMTKKAEALIGDGVQFPKQLSSASASTGIVHRFQENVNMKIMDQTQSLQFKRWFGDWQNDPKHASKVVDAEGKPLVVYHGTLAKGITAFNKDFIGSRYGSDEVGFFFIDRKSIAEDYARSEFNGDRYGEVIPAYLSIKNPLVVDAKYVRENGYGDIFKSNDAIDAWDTYQGAFLEAAQKLGADGILVKDGTSTMAVAFRPTQIKSATENVGTFDRRDPDIRFSQELESIEELRRENERLKERVEYDPAVADVTGLNGLAAVESFAAGLPPALATTVREMYNEEQEPAAYLEDMMRAHKAGGEGITDPEPVFGPGMENAHITYFQAKAAMLAGRNSAVMPRSAIKKGEAINGEALKDPRTVDIVSRIFNGESPAVALKEDGRNGYVQKGAEGPGTLQETHGEGGTDVAGGSGSARGEGRGAGQLAVSEGTPNPGGAVARRGQPGEVTTTGKQAAYLEANARNYTDSTIERYKNVTGLDVVVTSDRKGKESTGHARTEAAGEVYLRDGGQRADGAYPGGAVRELEGGAGQDQGRDLKSRPADGGAASLIYGEKVTTASLGIGGGSGSDGIRLVRGGDTAATAGARKIARERGLRVVLFAGGDLTIRRGGMTIRARGYVSGDQVFIRVDHPEYTAEQIMRHEAGHDMIAKGELDPEAVRERIIRELGEGKTEQITGMYEAAYRGTSLTAEEVWEEVVCDSLGDMNIFSGTIHEEAARELLKPTKEAAGAERETAKTRGPPEKSERASREIKYWRPNLKRAEWDLLNRKMKTAGKRLDDATYWVYAFEKGISVFAIYGIGDGTENTPLYASGGQTAARDEVTIKRYLEGLEYGVEKMGAAFDRWAASMRSEQGHGGSYFYDTAKRGAEDGDVPLSRKP